MVNGRGISTVLVSAALLVGCGGSDQAPAPVPRQQLAQAAPTLTPDVLMDWAEANYHDYFPTHGLSSTGLGYFYRAYSTATGTNYLGIKDGGIFVMGRGLSDVPWQVGTLAGYSCVVYSCGTSVTGTAAAGAPLAGLTITLKDSTNRSVTATTSVTGGYTMDTTGLAGPFLLQLTTLAGQRLYGVTADTSSDVVANLTPLTDLIVRSWYLVQGGSADNAFADPSLALPPTAQQTAVMAGAVFSVMQLALNTANAGVVDPVELINKPFSANHTGIDQVLDNTTITYGDAATLVVRGTGAQQTSVIGYETSGHVLAASSTTVSASNTTTTAISMVIPVQSTQASALGEIAATLNQVGTAISARGTSLTAADLAPYFDPGMIQDGLTAQQYAGMLASNFNGGQTVTVAIQRLASLDAVAGRAEGTVAFTSSLGGQSTIQSLKIVFRKVGGVWLFSGNDRIAQIEVQAEARVHQGSGGGTNGPLVNVSVLAPPATVNGVSAVGAPGNMTLSQHSTVMDGSGMLLDQFNAEQAMSGALPPAGTAYTVTLSKADGSTVSYVEALNAFTTEGVRITSPAGTSLADAKLNGTLNVSWALPSTYAVAAIQLSGTTYTGGMEMPSTLRCETPAALISATGTAASLNIPATCNGSPVMIVDLMLIVTGPNGEHSETHYVLQ